MSQTHITLDTVLKPGQTVEILISATIRVKVDIQEYLDGTDITDEWGEDGLTVEALQTDIENNMDLEDILAEWDVLDYSEEQFVTEVKVIKDK